MKLILRFAMLSVLLDIIVSCNPFCEDIIYVNEHESIYIDIYKDSLKHISFFTENFNKKEKFVVFVGIKRKEFCEIENIQMKYSFFSNERTNDSLVECSTLVVNYPYKTDTVFNSKNYFPVVAGYGANQFNFLAEENTKEERLFINILMKIKHQNSIDTSFVLKKKIIKRIKVH